MLKKTGSLQDLAPGRAPPCHGASRAWCQFRRLASAAATAGSGRADGRGGSFPIEGPGRAAAGPETTAIPATEWLSSLSLSQSSRRQI